MTLTTTFLAAAAFLVGGADNSDFQTKAAGLFSQPFRQAILEASGGGAYAVKIGLQASVWETRYFRSLTDKTVVRRTPGTAPLWMTQSGVPMIEETPNSSLPFQLVNLDIYHPEYHQRYLKLVRAFGASGIPHMPEIRFVYLHDKSASRGEEGWSESDQPTSGERWLRYQERLRAWADAFGPDCRKLMTVSAQSHILEVCYPLGIGQQNGFVEHYLMHAPNPLLGQSVDSDGYLRESLVPDRGVANTQPPRPIKNFERWLYQRDAAGARTVAAEQVPVPPQMFEYHKSHRYDMTARRTDVVNDQRRIRFGVDDDFLAGGPHRVAVKVTYVDQDNAEWELAFHSSPTAVSSRKIVCGETGRAKTATFILSEAYFPQQGYTGCDLEIRALRGDAVIRMVRLIRLSGGQDVR